MNWNIRKIAFYVSAENEESALSIAKNKLKVDKYEVSRVKARKQTIKGYPHKYPYTYGVYLREV